MEEKETFYTALGYYSNQVMHGRSILIKRELEYKSYLDEPSQLQSLICLTPAELKIKRADCINKENEVWDKMKILEQEWENCAAQTLLVDKAMEYVQTAEVVHTNNEWKQRKDGVWQISNRVYIMAYSISGDKDNSAPWLCQWGININKPKRPPTERFPYYGNDAVVEIKRKRFNSQADAQNYIQGRFDAYAYLFRELSPPIPYDYRRHFMINGCLLPDYTVAPPERTTPDKETVDALLDSLSDEDLPSAQAKPKAANTTDKAKRTAKKKPAPVQSR